MNDRVIEREKERHRERETERENHKTKEIREEEVSGG